MTPKQTQLYWREWSAAKKAGALTDHDRYEIMEEALGGARPPRAPLSSKDLTNDDLDKVLAAFRRISQPDNLNAQLHAQRQPRARLLHGLDQTAETLGWVYVCAIADDKFQADFSRLLYSEISNFKSAIIFDRLTLTQLKQLLVTLKQRLRSRPNRHALPPINTGLQSGAPAPEPLATVSTVSADEPF